MTARASDRLVAERRPMGLSRTDIYLLVRRLSLTGGLLFIPSQIIRTSKYDQIIYTQHSLLTPHSSTVRAARLHGP